MIDLGQHWEFVAAAYAGTFVVVGLLVGWTVMAAQASKARVAALEAQRGRNRVQ